jgi:hypothetical protein
MMVVFFGGVCVKEFCLEFMRNLGGKGSAAVRKAEFTTYLCEVLEERADIRNFELASYAGRGIYLDAYSWAEDLGRLTLFITDFSERLDDVESLSQGDVDRSFKRVKGFFKKACFPGFSDKIDSMDDAHWAAKCIAKNVSNIAHVHYVLFSNKKLSQRFESVREKVSGKIIESYDIWDIDRVHRLFDHPVEPLFVDFREFSADGIPCLKAFNDSDVCESYLLAIPGTLLAKVYERYGDRLLEQNVRTFLQFRGKVNSSIRKTLVQEPGMFFAYNNGLTMTAESVEFADHSLLRLENPQIVNGGQTTASIFMAKYKEKEHVIDLDKVHVPVKLTVVNPDCVDEVVPIISKCANTQNKVSESDFFSNHPFHQRMQEMSRRLSAPAKSGEFRETYWFYERSRGQFANETALMTPTQKNQYLKIHPKNQVITKVDVSKYDNVFRDAPHQASSGAETSFKYFAKVLTEKPGLWEKKKAQFSDGYFMDLVAKAILFRTLDVAIYRSEWYERHKAAVVCYTLAKYMHVLKGEKYTLDFPKIWKGQVVPEPLLNDLLLIAEQIQTLLLESQGNCYWKRGKCWEDVKAMHVGDIICHQDFTMSEDHSRETQKGIRQKGKVLGEVEDIVSLLEEPDGKKPAGYWRTMYDWANEKAGLMTPSEMTLLRKAANGMMNIDQLKFIKKVESKAEKANFIFA